MAKRERINELYYTRYSGIDFTKNEYILKAFYHARDANKINFYPIMFAKI